MYLLGIETSCDETGVALLHCSSTHNVQKQTILANLVRSSAYQHTKTQGIVPEVAARDHSRQLYILVKKALALAKIQVSQISAIGYTRGPGLIGSLMVGAAFAKSLGYSASIPTIGVHHLEGHICAAFDDSTTTKEQKPLRYPFLAMLVSGAHTHIFIVEKRFCYTLLGATRDDAAGEAFDKCATMIGLGYPGGAALSQLATQGDPLAFRFPRPMLDKPGLAMSFSGLKTAVRYQLCKLVPQHQPTNTRNIGIMLDEKTRADIAASIELAIVETLIGKINRAIQTTGITQILLAGGVCANVRLRKAAYTHWGENLYIPAADLCTDNGAMIALAAQKRYAHGLVDSNNSIDPQPNWALA